MGLRMSPEHERVGADYIEHELGPRAVDQYYADDKQWLEQIRRGSRETSQRGAFGTRTHGFTETNGDLPEVVEAEEAGASELRKRPIVSNGVNNTTCENNEDNDDFSKL